MSSLTLARSQPAEISTGKTSAGIAVWVVVPAYNEARRIAQTIRSVRAHCPNVVVVDDGSCDETSELALVEDIWVLRHPVNLGQGAALQTGIDFACHQGADVIVTFDADGQHSAADIDRMVEPIVQGKCDVTLGSRFLRSAAAIPLTRRWLLRLAVVFTRLMSRLEVTDTHNGLRAFSGQAAKRIRIRENRMAHASELLDQIKGLGLRFVEVPVHVSYSAETLQKGQSNWNAAHVASRYLLGKFIR